MKYQGGDGRVSRDQGCNLHQALLILTTHLPNHGYSSLSPNHRLLSKHSYKTGPKIPPPNHSDTPSSFDLVIVVLPLHQIWRPSSLERPKASMQGRGGELGERVGSGEAKFCSLLALIPLALQTSNKHTEPQKMPWSRESVRNLLMVENQVPTDHQQVRGNFFFLWGVMAGVSVGRERKLLCPSHQTK